MAETTAEVRRDIELTRERMSSTLAELEEKLDVMQAVRDNPWPAVALALGAGFLFARSRADVKAVAVTVAATKGTRSRLGSAFDDAVSTLVGGVHGVVEERLNGWVDELRGTINTSAAASSRGENRAEETGTPPMHAD
jgi:Protein of unknown function (DUF3618)